MSRPKSFRRHRQREDAAGNDPTMARGPLEVEEGAAEAGADADIAQGPRHTADVIETHEGSWLWTII